MILKLKFFKTQKATQLKNIILTIKNKKKEKNNIKFFLLSQIRICFKSKTFLKHSSSNYIIYNFSCFFSFFFF